jgi:tRNA A-37 threonylcarbamoyl transferase component Bud32
MRVLKIMHQDMMMDQKRRAKFCREAQLAAHLRHPAIVHVHDVTQTGTSIQIEMEYIDGLSLRQQLEARGHFPAPVAVALMVAVLEGLEHAHKARLTIHDSTFDGVIHRDLKPENIMLRSTGQPVICDFGVAKLGADQLSMTQNISGSVAYMAPERLRGELSTRGIDIFALGVTFFELLKGYRPIAGDSKAQVIENILRWVLLDIRHEMEGFDPSFAEIIEKAIARDPAERYADASQMLAALKPLYRLYHGERSAADVMKEFLTRGELSTSEFKALLTDSPSWSSRRTSWVLGMGVGAAGIVALGLYLFPQSKPVGFQALLAAGDLPAALVAADTLPALEKREAWFKVAAAYLHENKNPGQALLLANKVLDQSYHPRVALLRAEIYLDQGMGNMAQAELLRMQPLLSRLQPATRAEYHWLQVSLLEHKSRTQALNPKEIALRQASMKAFLADIPAEDPRASRAEALLGGGVAQQP